MGRILLLRGVMGTGKTTLQLIMHSGLRHFVQSELLSDYFDSPYLTFHELWEAINNESRTPEAVIQAHLDNSDDLIVEPGGLFGQLYNALRAQHDVHHAFLAAPDFLIAARQRSRLLARDDATVESVCDHREYQDLRARRLVCLAKEMDKWPAGISTTFIDASDLPYVEITRSRATEIIDTIGPIPHEVVNAGCNTHIIGSEALVNDGLAFNFRDADVLIVGADNAWLAHEAIDEQARSVFVVEADRQQYETLRLQRDAARLPVTLINMDLTGADLPPLHCYGELRKFSMGLLSIPNEWRSSERSLFTRLFNECETVIVLSNQATKGKSRRKALEEFASTLRFSRLSFIESHRESKLKHLF